MQLFKFIRKNRTESESRSLLLLWISFIYIFLFAFLCLFPYAYGVGLVSPLIVTQQGDIEFYNKFATMSMLDYYKFIVSAWNQINRLEFYPGPLFPILLNQFNYRASPIYLSMLFAIVGLVFQYIVGSWMIKNKLPLSMVIFSVLNPYVLLYSFVPSPDLLLTFFSFIIFIYFSEKANSKINIKLVVLAIFFSISVHPIGVMVPVYALLSISNNKVEKLAAKMVVLIIALLTMAFYFPYFLAMLSSISFSLGKNSELDFLALSHAEFIGIILTRFVNSFDFINIVSHLSKILGFQISQTGSIFHFLYRLIFGIIFLGGFINLSVRGSKEHRVFAIALLLPTLLTYPSTRYLMSVMPIFYIYFFKIFYANKD